MSQSNDSGVAIGCFLLTMFMVILFWLVTPAHSQTPQNPCAPTPSIIKMLKDKYGETPGVAAITENNLPLLIFTNPKTGTFTITLRQPGGVSCLMTSGQSWTLVEQPKEGTSL